jgi:hypothetical protein
MGLNAMSDGERWITAAILISALVLDLVWPRPDLNRRLAAHLLGSDGQRIELKTGSAFRVGARWALFFEGKGKVGPFRGVILIEDDRVRDLQLLETHEGIDHRAFSNPILAQSLVDQPAKAPVEVEVVSGATISSQLLIDAVNSSLKEWRAAVR